MTKVVHEAVVSLIPREAYARLSCQAIRGRGNSEVQEAAELLWPSFNMY